VPKAAAEGRSTARAAQKDSRSNLAAAIVVVPVELG
jgi:hypothetical protein